MSTIIFETMCLQQFNWDGRIVIVIFVFLQSEYYWSKVKVTFDLQISKVKIMVKVKPIGHIWGLEFNWYVCFSFRGNQTTFGWDIGNSIFDLENPRSWSWSMSNLMVIFEALEFNWYVCFSFHGQGHDANRPKSNQVIYRSGPTIVPQMKEIQKVVQKLSRGQEAVAGGGGGGGGGVRTSTKT